MEEGGDAINPLLPTLRTRERLGLDRDDDLQTVTREVTAAVDRNTDKVSLDQNVLNVSRDGKRRYGVGMVVNAEGDFLAKFGPGDWTAFPEKHLQEIPIAAGGGAGTTTKAVTFASEMVEQGAGGGADGSGGGAAAV
eukprot:g6511.t1